MLEFRQIELSLRPHARICLRDPYDSWRNTVPFNPFETEVRHTMQCFLEPDDDLSRFEKIFHWDEGPFGFGYMIKDDENSYCNLYASFGDNRRAELEASLLAASGGTVSIRLEPSFHSSSAVHDGKTAFALIEELDIAVVSRFGSMV